MRPFRKATFLVLLAWATLASLSACGGDPYVGTWQREGQRGAPRLVVALSDGGYRVHFVGTTVVEGWVPLRAEGEGLVGTPDAPLPVSVEITLSYDENADRLLYSDTVGLHVAYAKLDDSMVVASPAE
jgi:hypothetical protein